MSPNKFGIAALSKAKGAKARNKVSASQAKLTKEVLKVLLGPPRAASETRIVKFKQPRSVTFVLWLALDNPPPKNQQ